ncbi:MAG: hypothetical protein K6A70_04230 [Erysipelotrichaceae bacterium]|nr:hypothetical protein [Erysipelotrichaceae bacterium]
MKMPDNFSIKEIIVKHQMEVKGMLFSEAETEFEMNKLKNYYARIAVEEALKEEREMFIAAMRERGFSEEQIRSVIETIEKLESIKKV